MVSINILFRHSLNAELIDTLFKGDELLELPHRSTIDYIKGWMDEKEKSMEDEWSLQKKFEHLAFNEITAKILTHILESNPLSNHQSEKYWGLKYLELLLDY